MKSIITLLLNDRTCNYSCIYCYARFDHAKAMSVTPITDFSEIDKQYDGKLAELEAIGERAEFETTFWGGEPFANPHLKNVVKHLKDKYNSSFHAVTNGSLIDDKLADWLIENNFRVTLSNDLVYQQNRGWQYLEDKSRSEAIAKLARHGLLGGVQFVLSAESPNIMENLVYLMRWCSRAGLKKEELPNLGFLPIKAYSDEEDHLLFKEGTESTKIMQQSLLEFCEVVLRNPEFKMFKTTYKRYLYNAIMGLEGRGSEFFKKDDGSKDMATCAIYRTGCTDLLGRKWSCPHDFEKDPTTPNVRESYAPDPVCHACTFRGECNEICSGAHPEARRRSCESMQLIYRTIRYAIYKNSDEEERSNYVPESIEDLKRHILCND